MAILKGVQKPTAPIVASESDYGLYVGPKGSFAKAGLQGKEGKWEYLFMKDETGTVNLLNVLEYLHSKSSDFVSVERGMDKAVEQWEAYKKSLEPAPKEEPKEPKKKKDAA